GGRRDAGKWNTVVVSERDEMSFCLSDDDDKK
ncbi:hypothetical protein A2U01_0077257, partial [Trifolium medium]|nr:hypothetical protein [Trifolium medium]